jgi:hypothetical protein
MCRHAVLRCRRATVFAWTIAMAMLGPRHAAAAVVGHDVPILGGTAAMARSVGMDPVPERPRFLAELVRVVYDKVEGKNADADAKLARLANHLVVVGHFQSALTAVQPAGAGIALSMAAVKNDRNRLKEFLDLVGLKLREKSKAFSVERTDNKQAAERLTLLADIGIDLGKLAGRLNAGETVRIEVPTEAVPVPLDATVWSDAVFQRPVTAATLFATIVADRRAALVAHGLAALDDDTLAFLADHPAVLTRLYEHDASTFAAFGDALHIHEGRVVPAGGADGVRAWEAVIDEKVAQPDRFVRELFGSHQGRLALVYQTLTQLDPPHVRFALGSWMPDPSKRVEQFKALIAAAVSREEWDVNQGPFIRPVYDVSTMLTRIRVQPNGAPVSPTPRVFWQRAFESADLPDDPARQLRNLAEDGSVDAGWLAANMSMADPEIRAERLDQLTFGQRAFNSAPMADLPHVLVAIRALPRFRMLMLTLDRMGVRSPATYAAAARQAHALTALDGRRRFVALAEFQGALAATVRLVRVRSLNTTAAELLVSSLMAVTVHDNGQYDGGLARWIDRELAPALTWSSGGKADVDLVRPLAGTIDPAVAATKVTWEGRAYRLDLVTPEQHRLTTVLDKMGSLPLHVSLDLQHVATTLSAPSVSVADVRAAAADLKTIVSGIAPPDKRAAAVLPPGVDAPTPPQDTTSRALKDLAQIGQPKDVKKAARVAEHLFALSDELLAQTLMSVAYALDVGSPEGTTLMGGDVSRRHDFGFQARDEEHRIRAAWAEPVQGKTAGMPWHMTGSLLGLDTGLAKLALRRIDTGEVPSEPVLSAPQRTTLTKTVALINPFALTDDGRDAIVAAIARGRSRVAAISTDGAWDAAADEIRMDGWRRRAGRWAMAHETTLVPTLFSLVELLYLGAPTADLPLDRWGMASDETDACLCTAMPPPGQAALVSGRLRFGALATHVADINLRIAEELSRLHLPAALARGVLAAAVLDYVDQVRPRDGNDWLTLVRTAQAIPGPRVEDYVAALTADGPLVMDRPTSGGGGPR